jgi:positive regulator of sigma E activity
MTLPRAMPRRAVDGRERSAVGCRERLTADAIVRSVDADGYVELEFDLASRCAGCAGMCTWTRSDASPKRIRLRSNVAVGPGTLVRVTLPADRVMRSALLLHGAPLVALLVGGAGGAALTGTDFGTLIGALLAITGAVLGTRHVRKQAEDSTLAGARLELRG